VLYFMTSGTASLPFDHIHGVVLLAADIGFQKLKQQLALYIW